MKQEAPITDSMVEGFGDDDDKKGFNGKPKLSWILFFQNLIAGDKGTTWSPISHNLTTVGIPQITGTYYKNSGFTDFFIRIVPGTSTTATAGTTYFDLPFDVLIDGPCFAISGLLGSNAGAVDSATNRCYVPSWSAVTVPLTVYGRVRA